MPGNLEDGGETLPVGEEVWVVHQPGHQRLEGGHDGGVQVLAVRLHQSQISIQNMDQSQLSIQNMDQSLLTWGGREHCATMKSHNHLTARLHSRASAGGKIHCIKTINFSKQALIKLDKIKQY